MMRDDERIEMYYKFGLLDWKNEQQLQKITDEKIIKAYLIYLWLMFRRLFGKTIQHVKR